MKEKPVLLLIDDDERVLRSLSVLFKHSHKVFYTTDPKEFLEILDKEQVHVVVSDQRMPQVKGTDLLKKVKFSSPNSMRILLTGYADIDAVMASINESEIYRYLTKPWNPEELRQVVAKATLIALKLQENYEAEQQGAISASGHKVTAAPVKAAVEAPRETSGETLLILEDTPGLASEIKGLYAGQHDVFAASSTEEAQAILSDNRVSVAICDVSLETTEIEPTIAALKNAAPDLVVILITSFQDTGLLIELINKRQIYRCLPRPVSKSLLGKSITHAINHYYTLIPAPN